MKNFLLISLILIVCNADLYAMYPDDEFGADEETEEYIEIIRPIAKIWALPETNDAKEGYVYNAGHTLHHVIENGSLDHVKSCLVLATANQINQRDAEGNIPLHIAARLPSYHKVGLLLNMGADYDAKNNQDKDPTDLMPEVVVDFQAPITSILQTPFVIQAMMVAKATHLKYELIICEDGQLRL